MSTIHNPYAIPAGLDMPDEDREEMEASPMNLNKYIPTDSHDLDKQDPVERPHCQHYQQCRRRGNGKLWRWQFTYDAAIIHQTNLQGNTARWSMPLCALGYIEIPLTGKPLNAENVVLDSLANFIDYTGLEDKHSMVFPHNLSEYQRVEDLPPIINDVKNFQRWWMSGYPISLKKTTFQRGWHLHIGPHWSEHPIPQIHQNDKWMVQNKGYDLWLLALQLEKPVSLGWLLFSTFTMNMEILKIIIMESMEY